MNLSAIEGIEKELLSTQRYESERARRRSDVIRVKRGRRVSLGANIFLLFENRQTVLFQLQESLLVESVAGAKRVRRTIEEYVMLLPGEGRITASLMLCVGRKGDALALSNAIRDGQLTLRLGSQLARARTVDGDDPYCPIRYVAFDRWGDAGADRGGAELRLRYRGEELVTVVDPPLADALFGERGSTR